MKDNEAALGIVLSIVVLIIIVVYSIAHRIDMNLERNCVRVDRPENGVVVLVCTPEAVARYKGKEIKNEKPR